MHYRANRQPHATMYADIDVSMLACWALTILNYVTALEDLAWALSIRAAKTSTCQLGWVL